MKQLVTKELNIANYQPFDRILFAKYHSLQHYPTSYIATIAMIILIISSI